MSSSVHVAEAISDDAVLSVISEITRYPRDVLVGEAVLEDDLGIDSLKRVEIWAGLSQRFNWQLPGLSAVIQDGVPNLSEMKLSEEEAMLLASIRTVADVSRAARELDVKVRNGTLNLAPAKQLALPAVVAPPAPAPAPAPVAVKANGNGHAPAPVPARNGYAASPVGPATTATLERLAAATGYPVDVFFAEAQLEDDLGLTAGRVNELITQLTGDASRATGRTPTTVKELLSVLDSAPAAVVARKPLTKSVPVAAKPFTISLAGKIALVTGSGHGVGKAIALALADAGATVVINSFHSKQKGDDTTKLINDSGGKAIHCWGSVAKPDHLTRVFSEIDQAFGGLDFFVSNASNGALLPTADITPEYWERAFRTNVIGFHQASLLAAALMKKRGGGKIISLSSIGSHRVIEYFACMGTVKAAVESLTRYLAVEFAPQNIDMVCLSAGAIEGELLDKWPDGDALKQKWRSKTMRGQFLNEQEYAELVAMHLAVPSRFQGQTLYIDDGGALRV